MPTVPHRVRHATRQLVRQSAAAIERPAALARRPATRSVVAFIGSRAVSAALMLAQLAVVAALFDTAAAATFFVLWTLVWASSVWLRFGVDQVIPRQGGAREDNRRPRRAGRRPRRRRAHRARARRGPAAARRRVARVRPGGADRRSSLPSASPLPSPGARSCCSPRCCAASTPSGARARVQGVMPSAALLAASAIAPQISDGWLGLLAREHGRAVGRAARRGRRGGAGDRAQRDRRDAVRARPSRRRAASRRVADRARAKSASPCRCCSARRSGCRTPISLRCTPLPVSRGCSRGRRAPSPRWRRRAWRWRSPAAAPSVRCCAARRSRRRRRRCRSARSASCSRRSCSAR